jgi:acyl-CoA synthetase (AMP-forming)/AMP-acid ligase II
MTATGEPPFKEEETMVIGDLIENNARRIPDHVGLVWNDERITWRQLNERANQMANAMIALGVTPGDRVAFILDNSRELVELYFAIAKAGAIAVPILPRSVGREIAYIVNNVDAHTLFVQASYASLVEGIKADLPSSISLVGVGRRHAFPSDYDRLAAAADTTEPGVKVDPDAICTIFHTSGTTGKPKGCILKHGKKVLSRLAALAMTPYTDKDIALVFYPLTLSFSADMLLTHVLRGITTVLLPYFDAELVLQSIEKEKITIAYVIESTFDRLMEHPDLEKYDLSRLVYLYATSATKDASTGIRKLRQIKGFKAKFWNAYGSTEGGGWLTYSGPEDIDRSLTDPGFSDVFRSIGRENILCRIDCVDENGEALPPGEIGEMVIRSPWLFSGYWNQPDQTAEVLIDGRFHTGDLASKDPNGFVILEGRKKDMIKTGGINVYPAEIEAVFKENPNVREVAVVGIPDDHWGEKVVACVVAREPVSEEALLAHCGDKLAGFKRPKSVVFYDSLPADKAGKILKRQLREELTG